MQLPTLRSGATGVAALVALAAVAAAALPAEAADPAGAGSRPAAVVQPSADLATDLLSPLSVAAGSDGVLWFSQNLAGALMELPVGQSANRVYQARGNLLVGGVSVVGPTTYFTLSGKAATYGRLMSIKTGGKAQEVADLGAYEAAHNPDGRQRYGFRGLSESCAAAFKGTRTPSFTGTVQTYPYDTLVQGNKAYVVDSSANAILKVRGNGRVSTVAVLAPVKTTMTASYAKQQKLPRCTVGKTYRADAVPTAVAAGPGGSLYVATRGGGPAVEGDQAAGAVWSLNPRSGKLKAVAKGLVTPTGLTVAPDGDLYVAELFGGAIVRIPAGSRSAVPFAQVPFPGDVLTTAGGLVATTNVLSGTSGKAGDPANANVVRYPYE